MMILSRVTCLTNMILENSGLCIYATTSGKVYHLWCKSIVQNLLYHIKVQV